MTVTVDATALGGSVRVTHGDGYCQRDVRRVVCSGCPAVSCTTGLAFAASLEPGDDQ